MAEPKTSDFPEADAWAAEIGTQFQAAAPRKPAASPAASNTVDREFKTFVAIDLTNIGR